MEPSSKNCSSYPKENEFIDLDRIQKGLLESKIISTNLEIEDKPNKVLQVFLNIITCGIYYLVRKKNHDVKIIVSNLINKLEEYQKNPPKLDPSFPLDFLTEREINNMNQKFTDRENQIKDSENYLKTLGDDENTLQSYDSLPLMLQTKFIEIKREKESDYKNKEDEAFLKDLRKTTECQNYLNKGGEDEWLAYSYRIGNNNVYVRFGYEEKESEISIDKFEEYTKIQNEKNTDVSIENLRFLVAEERGNLEKERVDFAKKPKSKEEAVEIMQKAQLAERLNKTMSVIDALEDRTHKSFKDDHLHKLRLLNEIIKSQR